MSRKVWAIVISVAAVIAGAVALIVLLLRNSSSSEQPNDTKSNATVLIIGAGVAGARAANTLSKADVSFVIVEATGQVGGRLRTAQLDEDTVIEVGGNWIHGYGNRHPVEKYADNMALKGVPTDFDDRAFFSNSRQVPRNEDRNVWSNLIKAMSRAVDFDSADIPLSTALKERSDWVPDTELKCATEQFAVDYSYAVGAPDIGSVHVDKDITLDDPKTERLIVDSRGYAEIVRQLLKDAGAKEKENLFLNSRVTTVEYSDNEAKVTLQNGTVLQVDAVISTVSIGVLKSGYIKFKPDLSSAKKNALQKLDMGAYTKCFVKFNREILNEQNPVVLIPASCDKKTSVMNLNRDPFFPGSNIMLVTFLSETSRALKESDALAQSLEAVSEVSGNELNPQDVESTVCGKWNEDPLFGGSYSYRKAGFGNNDIDELLEPEGTVYLAGEALLKDDFGSVNSAWTSGEQAAKRVINDFE